MPLPLLALAGISAAPQLLKLGQGILQGQKAKKVKVEDTQPAASKENLALLRGSANAQMPGYGLMEGQLAQNQAAVAGQALRAGGSSSDIMASIGAADARRQQGLANLNVQNQQYQAQGRRALSAGLLQQAAYQKADQDTASRTRAALKQASATNVFGAVDGLANTGAYFGSTAGQNQVNGVGGFNLLGGSGAYDSNPNTRALMRGYA
ncbi:hypothetical protein [Hymenobacter metallicola]|uniref:Uncharacterized protein n=1 Tax=Hymenobacter metallicola TaxID=2563114 RepID=A0A4Z0QJD6_9BACT|nr:hypothetical protein [Hymenobacter metallicola]TGE29805.1 hypothetical protein E5K02_10200 [Hymenobacter metallicola]